MKAIKPNFFIIGAAKAGTTSLYHYLKQHNGIYFSPIKEPNYFSTDINPAHFMSDYRKHTVFVDDKYFAKKPLKDLHLSFVRKEDHYFQLFENVTSETAIGECSTSYLFSSCAADEIRRFNPEAKIIAILRNPVERAFSHYLMGLRFGYTKKSFRQALEEDMKQNRKGWGISKLYLELGLYAQQIQRYFDSFDKSQIRIYLNDELSVDVQKTISAIFHFLEVEDQRIITSEKFNQARIPKNKALNQLVYQSTLPRIMQSILPKPMIQKVKKLYYEKQESIEINPADKAFLRDYYCSDIINTQKITGKDLSHWLD
jgi:hypothetical protein